jgi:DNA polymerase elongation subunit (family B)
VTGPKILTLDIETMPAIAEVFSLWDSHIPIQRVREPGYVFGFGWKWHGEKPVHWFNQEPDSRVLAARARDLLDRADIVVTYNGDKFDLPALNTAILAARMHPPSPYKSVDLYKTVKRRLKLESNKLDYAARILGLGAKVQTDYGLWQGCMAGDPKAVAKMARYCKHDVRLTEKLHDLILPWITNYPNVNLWLPDDGRPTCRVCGSDRMQKRGHQRVIAQTYQRFQCQACGAWSRGTAILDRATGVRAA